MLQAQRDVTQWVRQQRLQRFIPDGPVSTRTHAERWRAKHSSMTIQLRTRCSGLSSWPARSQQQAPTEHNGRIDTAHHKQQTENGRVHKHIHGAQPSTTEGARMHATRARSKIHMPAATHLLLRHVREEIGVLVEIAWYFGHERAARHAVIRKQHALKHGQRT